MPINLRIGSSWSTHSILKRKDKNKSNKSNSNHHQDHNQIIREEEEEEEEQQQQQQQQQQEHSLSSLHIANQFNQTHSNSNYHHLHPTPPLPNRPTSNLHQQSFNNLNDSSSNSNLPSLQPFSPEYTIAILHIQNISSAIKTTIESRLTSTGFKFTSQLTINLSEDHQDHLINDLSPIAKSGFQSGLNLIYLLNRARAIQVWKDLVGQSNFIPTTNHSSDSTPTTISRPGSLSSMFGKDVIWAAENLEREWT
ncbi:uncharacterized protein MELLADRAFT_115841 [Melampsora larici-populina 98AG31]|uniref:Uncharacterized protein n=1 Tax=Melampsora larici-populina (strain 98AG31 / pathotype 3-4-7) TaxID=747676 RepID=F4RET3_MELLP|nr:uncharacterized protein MELLADRAFT_115841 [Melampsora larici-populina 98AG31]EGG09155.1 hypothetical protein MELLADRAFT_115841 [Melampsora larici-populina 98AG31]